MTIKKTYSEGFFDRNFGLNKDLVGKVIEHALGRGGDFAEVFVQYRVSNFIGFEDGQVNRAFTEVDLGAGIRVLKGDQTGYAFTEDLTEAKMIEAATTAASIATGPSRVTRVGLKKLIVPNLYSMASPWSEALATDKISIVQRVGEKILAEDRQILKAAVQFGDEEEALLVANSEGVWAEDYRPMTYMYASCTAEKNNQIESNSYSRSGRFDASFYTDDLIAKMAREAVHRTMILFDAKIPTAGEMPVVLAPATSGILLHEAMGHGFEADFNRKKISIFSEMMGKKVAEDFVTIVDTGLIPGARGSIAVDDEGTLSKETVLVKNGKLISYLHDRISAAHFGVDRTGNGRRESFRHAPLPRMRVTAMENGPHDPEEIIRSVKKGLYAVDFANGEVSIGAGDYSFYVKTGYMIEDGKLTAPIKDVNLIGNGPDTLAKTVMVGNDKAVDEGTWTCGKDGQSVPCGLGLPTIKVSNITVGGINS